MKDILIIGMAVLGIVFGWYLIYRLDRNIKRIKKRLGVI